MQAPFVFFWGWSWGEWIKVSLLPGRMKKRVTLALGNYIAISLRCRSNSYQEASVSLSHWMADTAGSGDLVCIFFKSSTIGPDRGAIVENDPVDPFIRYQFHGVS